MKQFNIAEQQQIVFGNVFPTGAIYGSFTHTYVRKYVCGYKVVTNKNGQTVYNKDGMPKIGKNWKREKITISAVFVVKKAGFAKHADNNSIVCDLLYQNATNWKRDVHLGDSPFSIALQAHILKNCEERGINFEKHRIDPPRVKSKNDYKPTRRNVQTDYLYKGQFGYAVDPNVINWDVKPRMPHCGKKQVFPDVEKPALVRRPMTVFVVFPIMGAESCHYYEYSAKMEMQARIANGETGVSYKEYPETQGKALCGIKD